MTKTVLSLFGGIEGGKMALDALGIETDLYLSSEIDPYPIQNTKHNYPDIKHIGNVSDIKYENKRLYFGPCEMDDGDFEIYPTQDCYPSIEIYLLIAGSPCQDVSNAGNQKGLASTMEEYLERKKQEQPLALIYSGNLSEYGKRQNQNTSCLRM